ncbi:MULTISPECIES: DUF5324 family protein [unclassified Streptomyces]|uniref:DUF5324 family protein n=1 Tax=unclassified Streptomyces TaxID=2593676 RepID=UPI00168AD860|nr:MULTISPECIES: DUF5324 family protein [unclassified Streptomyces]MBD3009413.1 DUF5324 family protein [Streptomyces sp. 5-10]
MTRIDSVRAATGTAKGSVLHAAEAVAPYAGTAKDTATRYAHEARVRLAPKVSTAAHQARSTAGAQYHAHVAPRLNQARGTLPPKVDKAATRAAKRTRKAARHAADYTAPRVEQAMAGVRAAAGPAREEATIRTAAAIAALRTHVTAAEIEKLARKHRRRARTARFAKRATFIGLVGAGVFAAWKWWDKQANPDWLVEPPAATEVGDRERLSAVDGSDQNALDPEVQAKQAEAEARRDDER